jgi:hypothetical protein
MVALGLLGACSSSSGSGARQGAVPSNSSPASTSSSKLGTEALYSYFPATGAQFSVGAQFAGTMKSLRDTLMARCLAKRGFRMPVESKSTRITGFFDNSAFPDLDRISRTGMLTPDLLTPGAGPPAVSAAQMPAYQADVRRCQQTVLKPFAPLISAADPLQSQWQQIVSQVEVSPSVASLADGFRSCVEHEGVPASPMTRPGAGGALGGFLNWVTGQESKAADNKARAAVDRHWAPIFVRCAKPVITAEDKSRLARQHTFFQDHYQQIQSVQQLAPKVVTTVTAESGTG